MNTTCPRCKNRDLTFRTITVDDETHLLTRCCGSSIEELMQDYELEISLSYDGEP